jgi:hypothetical protein
VVLWLTQDQVDALKLLARDGPQAPDLNALPRITLTSLVRKRLAKPVPGCDRFAATRAGQDFAAGLRSLSEASEPVSVPVSPAANLP